MPELRMPVPMTVTDLLDPQCVVVPLNASTKREAIDGLVDAMASTGRVSDAAAVKKAVWEREQQRSTGIGEGLAIPHGKTSAAHGLCLAVGRLASPIEYDSIDRKPVRLVVLLVSPPERTSDHIQALGRISRLMTSPSFREQVYAAEDAQQLVSLFRAAERS
ncbi:MAG: PTS sugar transporter subunit IIA [Planctomycetes bacterium]|nr:PTS sugar transporter subunit IIA [Planctomycetota bacterium]